MYKFDWSIKILLKNYLMTSNAKGNEKLWAVGSEFEKCEEYIFESFLSAMILLDCTLTNFFKFFVFMDTLVLFGSWSFSLSCF